MEKLPLLFKMEGIKEEIWELEIAVTKMGRCLCTNPIIWYNAGEITFCNGASFGAALRSVQPEDLKACPLVAGRPLM